MHIIRFEDVMEKPAPVMADLLKFILNVDSLEGTKVEKYIKLACEESAPQVYKPREGKVHGNKGKYT